MIAATGAGLEKIIEMFRKSTTASLMLCLGLTMAELLGCAANRLSHDVRPFVGRDVHVLVAHLGNPTGKVETTGDRVLVWSADGEGVLPTASATENSATSLMTVHHACTLEVTINALNVIQSYQVEGSDAGCALFRSRLWH
jgi:hypothetical protein